MGHHCNTMVPLRSGPPQLWGSTFLVRRKHGWSVPQLEQSSAIVNLLGWVGKGFPLWLMMGFKVIPKSKATHQSHVGTIWQALNLGKPRNSSLVHWMFLEGRHLASLNWALHESIASKKLVIRPIYEDLYNLPNGLKWIGQLLY